jgi:hypothetical protein
VKYVNPFLMVSPRGSAHTLSRIEVVEVQLSYQMLEVKEVFS